MSEPNRSPIIIGVRRDLGHSKDPLETPLTFAKFQDGTVIVVLNGNAMTVRLADLSNVIRMLEAQA